MTVSIAAGSPSRAAASDGTGAARCPRSTSVSSPSYGGLPAKASNSTQPSAYTSVASVTGCPSICSGARYATGPK